MSETKRYTIAIGDAIYRAGFIDYCGDEGWPRYGCRACKVARITDGSVYIEPEEPGFIALDA
jgi:hypothetical protein